jgi:hypothetical protein
MLFSVTDGGRVEALYTSLHLYDFFDDWFGVDLAAADTRKSAFVAGMSQLSFSKLTCCACCAHTAWLFNHLLRPFQVGAAALLTPYVKRQVDAWLGSWDDMPK